MFFLFIVFGCRAIAGPCRGFEMCRQISRFRGIISRLGQLKFAVRAVTGTSRKIAVSALSLPFPCQRVGREEIYPAGRYGSTSQGTSNPLSENSFSADKPGGFGAEFDFFPAFSRAAGTAARA